MVKLEDSHDFQLLEGEELEDVKKMGVAFAEGAVRVNPERTILPIFYKDFADYIYNFKFRKSDILVLGYPKSGTTWLQEIIWNMTNNSDFKNEHRDIDIYIKSPFFEENIYGPGVPIINSFGYKDSFQTAFPNLTYDATLTWDKYLNNLPDPRVMKSHMPPSLLNHELLNTSKVVFIVRDPKDVLVSYYYFAKQFIPMSFDGTLEEFAQVFMKGRIMFGGMSDLLKQWWPYRHLKNVLFIYYEDLSLKTLPELRRLNNFLGCQLSDEKLEKVKHLTSFNEMKKRNTFFSADVIEGKSYYNELAKEYGGFLRKGIIGDSRETLSPILHKTLEEHFKQSFAGISLPYPYLNEERK